MGTRNPGLVAPAAALLLLACVSAEQRAGEAIAAAEQALASIETDAAQVAPGALAELRDSVTMARDRLAAGAPAEARALVDSIPVHVEALRARLSELGAEMQTTWDSLVVAMPRNLDAVRARADQILRTRRFPPGTDAGQVRSIRSLADSAAAAWDEAKARWERGERAEAMGEAFALKARVSEAMVALGLVADDRAWGNARPIGA